MRTDAVADTSLEDPRAFVAQMPLREYQEPKDTDGDGLRDWLEELLGTDPYINDATRIASTTASGTPFIADTETKKFAISFFEEMMHQHGGDSLTPEETEAVVARSMREFQSLNETELYNRTDITIIDDDSKELMREYGNAVGTAILANNTKPEGVEHELVILGRALEKDDAALIADMAIIRKNYEGMVAEILTVPVPREAVDAHLALLNSLKAIHDDVVAFENAFKDPLVAFLRIKRYQNDAVALGVSVDLVRRALERENIVYRNDEAGQLFFTFRP